MKLLLLVLSIASPLFAATWPLDDAGDSLIIRGKATAAAGTAGQCLVLDGDSVIELKDSANLGGGEFTVSLWFNPYDLAGGQQMLVGKNRYSHNERQWSLTIEPNGKLKAYLQQGGWSTISCAEPLKAGAWHWVTLVVDSEKAALFLNGKPAGEVGLKTPVASTGAPITLGGIWDADKVRQPFTGALDELTLEPRALKAEEVAAGYRPVSAMHDVTKVVGLPLWDETRPFPKAAELPQAAGAEFHVIKNQRPDTDQCRFTLGVGLAWHKGRLYASYGFNRGEENTPTEEAHVKVSDDGGKTWGPAQVMDAGEGDLAVSHGVFLSQGGRLWAFMGAYHAHEQKYHRVHTRAYLLDEATGRWEPKGVVIENGFWPMQEPQKMADGNWIMAGLHLSPFAKGENLPTVAISKGDDFTKWEPVVIPAAPRVGTNLWGESTVIVEGKKVINLSRYGRKARALLSTSEDYGRTWTPTALSNLPMATSKPYAGTLSTGQRYLVCTTTADTGGKRSPLTIAVSKPGESLFSQVFLIRHSVSENTPGISDPKADFSYPYAVEHEGKLYIGYTHKSHAANELAVIPIASLSVGAEASPGASLESRGLPRILFNNDSDDLKWPAYPEHHASVWVPAGKPIPLPAIRSPEDYLALRIGPLAKTGATGLAYCGNFGLLIWELKRDPIASLGDDPLQPILQFWKRDGRSFFFSLRMNDKHHAYFNWAHLWDEFRRTHRHWFLQPPSDAEWKNDFLPWLNDPARPGPQEMWARVKTQPEELRAGPNREANGEDLLYDYSKAEVRSHYLDIMREACRRYDLDGVELDWLRYPKFFRDGEVNAAVLTEFVREARTILDEAAKRRGHTLRLVTRVPDSPARAKELGLDVEAWLKAGWIDAVIAGNGFTFGSNTLDQWVTLAHRHRVPVYGVIERMPRGFARYGSPETLRAAAATLWARGADGLYTFNFYNTAEYPLLAELSDPARLEHLPKEFFVDACSVTNNTTVNETPLPLAMKASTPATTRLFIADDPAVARETSLEIVFKAEGEFEPPATTLNGQPLHELKSTRSKSDLTLTLSSTALKQALKPGANDFSFTSPASFTLTSLSVRVVP